MQRRIRGLMRRLLRETRGSIALKFALAVPAIAVLSIGAIDLLAVTSAKTRLQAIADAGALAGAPALALATDGAAARERSASFVAGQLSQWSDAPTVVETYEVVTQEMGGEEQRGIRVLLQANRLSFFANMLPPGGWNFVGDATATSVGLVPLCVLNTANAGDRLLELASRSRIEAPECLVHSNHTITVKDRSEIRGEAVQAVLAASGNIVPRAGTDAARIEDPFAGLPLDNPGGVCSTANVNRTTKRIRPGLHCAIKITGNDTYILEPGEHWFVSGALTVSGNAALTGEDVVLLVGKNGELDFSGNGRVDLIGRQSGPYAGLVVAVLPEHDEKITINSTRVERLEGAIYVPNAILEIAGKSDVARQSAWTVIVAASLMLTGSPNVFINANYGASDVPVPGGVGPGLGGSRLID
jgi:Flp pilus assembly pilin Flp